jgi:peptidylprolyl isomerase
MKLTPALFLLATVAPLAAQTTTHGTSAAHSTTATHSATHSGASACVKLPEISPKIPALPAGAPCAKHLFSITTVPAVRLENISPLASRTLAADLGIEPTTFSLDYIDTKIGTGELAGAHSWYTMNYTGYLYDGTKFDSSADHPEAFVFPYGAHKVIPGWDVGLAGMRVGGRRRLFIPFQLAYGAQSPSPKIPPRSNMIFDIELVKISELPPPEPKPVTPPTPPKPANPPATPGGVPPVNGATAPKPLAAPATAPAAPTQAPAKPATTPPPATSAPPPANSKP